VERNYRMIKIARKNNKLKNKPKEKQKLIQMNDTLNN